MTLIKIIHESYWECPICGQECDIWNWEDESGDGEYYYENPIYGCSDCDIEWRVEKTYKIDSIDSYIEQEFVDPNNIKSHRFVGILKIHGQE